MRVLILLPSSLVGGAERIASNLTEHLLARGDEVTVVTMSRGKGSFWPRLSGRQGFEHIAIASKRERGGVISLLRLLPQLASRGSFDLVYTSHVHINALASLLMRLRLLRSRHLVSRESTRIFDRFNGLRRLVYRLCYALYGRQDLLIFQTPEMQQSLHDVVRLPKHIRQMVLPNPVNLASIDAALAESLQFEDGRYRIVFCGRLIPLKRVDLLLRALAGLAQEDWSLDVLGDGPLRGELEQLTAELALSDQVQFHGQVGNPCRHFAVADLGVLCSEIEGFPNVLLEMMASGTRQIMSTPCTNAVRALPAIEIVETATPEALSASLSRAIDARPDHSLTFRRYIERERSIEYFFDQILANLPERTAAHSKLETAAAAR